MKYTLQYNDDGIELKDWNDDVIYTDDHAFTWPDEDAIMEMLDDANVGNPQKALFMLLFTGPEVVDERSTDQS